ncbi:phage head-tail family protein [Stylonychia lemnae]|uniref:Phage head-tail family protein n=1 Tax=Stylonychia lemnae TaxID=5949 RepID=A0A078ACK2_STYLE|nr:phage head-tail family protein [Stylonychia lemnae]|eukprot:CDW78563.1 phage head-tail family protein [Stylonychia lemnae]
MKKANQKRQKQKYVVKGSIPSSTTQTQPQDLIKPEETKHDITIIYLNGEKYSQIEDIQKYETIRQVRTRLNFKFEYYFIDLESYEIEKENEKNIGPAQIKTDDNKIHLMQRAIEMPLSFSTIEDYVNKIRDILTNEELIDQYKDKEVRVAKFIFDENEQRQITKRLLIILDKSDNIKPKSFIQVTLTPVDKDEQIYTGMASVFSISFKENQKIVVAVDLNIFTPHNEKQELPKSDQDYYHHTLKYQKIERLGKYTSAKNALNIFSLNQDKSEEILKAAIFSCDQMKSQNKQLPKEIIIPGIPDTFSSSQREAVKSALTGRLTLIQGPPGTGKTTVLQAVAAHMVSENYRNNIHTPILICAPSNAAADLIAERLRFVPSLNGNYIRLQSEHREDIFNTNMNNLREYDLLQKIMFMDILEAQDEVNKQFISVDRQQAKQTVEYYFSDANYYFKDGIGDVFLKSLEIQDGQNYIEIEKILQFYRMKQFRVSREEIVDFSRYAFNFEVDRSGFYIRKKIADKSAILKLLGFNSSSVRTFTPEELFNLKDLKLKIEQKTLGRAAAIITTCLNSFDKRLKGIKFRQVIIDEAAQCQEIETLIALRNANHAVLIGDQMQLGPRYSSLIDGPKSMFERMYLAKYPLEMLTTQYRMHPFLLTLPNQMFYNNKIENGYIQQYKNQFIDKEKPMLFIHIDSTESKFGTSYFNMEEAQAVKDITDFLVLRQNYDRRRFGFISGYNGQIQKLSSVLRGFNLQENSIGTVDSYQGRECDFVIFSAVRSNSHKKSNGIGFLSDKNRANVALTRAQHGLIIIGNKNFLSKDHKWKLYITFLEQNQVVVNGVQGAVDYILKMNSRIGAQSVIDSSAFNPDEDFM